MNAALEAVGNSVPENEIAPTLAKIKDATLADDLAAAAAAANAFDNATKSINKAVDKLDETLMAGDKNVFRDFSAARLRYTAARYDAEARLNQSIAGIYELQVRKGNLSAERHHRAQREIFLRDARRADGGDHRHVLHRRAAEEFSLVAGRRRRAGRRVVRRLRLFLRMNDAKSRTVVAERSGDTAFRAAICFRTAAWRFASRRIQS